MLSFSPFVAVILADYFLYAFAVCALLLPLSAAYAAIRLFRAGENTAGMISAMFWPAILYYAYKYRSERFLRKPALLFSFLFVVCVVTYLASGLILTMRAG